MSPCLYTLPIVFHVSMYYNNTCKAREQPFTKGSEAIVSKLLAPAIVAIFRRAIVAKPLMKFCVPRPINDGQCRKERRQHFRAFCDFLKLRHRRNLLAGRPRGSGPAA